MPANDLRKRLDRLRAVQRKHPQLHTADQIAAPRPKPSRANGLPGQTVSGPLGSFQLIETRYNLAFEHGPLRLADLLAHDSATAARLARDEALAGCDLSNLAFFDTETTGLSTTAGTLIFLAGIGVCEGDEFVLRQYFLSDPGQELALLTALLDDLAPRSGWVTFNGRSFDMPLLESRLTVNRQRGALGRRPHLDLLMPARRLYRGRLASCSLNSLEQQVLHVLREDDDVPGALIPQMYLDYLRTGDAREMQRVIYHNTVDILSMVTLAAHLLEAFSTPAANARRPAARKPEDLLRLALWHDDAGRAQEAEEAYHLALAGRLGLDDRRKGLRRLALLLRRQGRRGEAAPLWEQMASFALDDPEPFVELAKHYEWHARDLALALAWTDKALALAAGWPRGWQRDTAREALAHRRTRLLNSQAREEAARKRRAER